MLICSLCAYYVVGIVTFFVVAISFNGKVTLGDVVMAPFAAPGWPVFLLLTLAFRAEEIVVWRRKC